VNQGNATVTVNGNAVASGQASGSINLNVGANAITVVVTAQDTTTTKTYTISVTRAAPPSSDATLSNLTISAGTLTPGFTSANTSYTDSVANTITAVTVTPTVNQGNATVTVNGNAVASGQASGSINLNVGANAITVVVTAQDTTTTKTYTISVTGAGPSSSSFGYNATGTTSVSGTYNNFYFCTPGFTGVTSTGVSMSALVSNSDTSSAHNIQLAIYTLSGSTYSLVAHTNSISIPANAAKGWVTGNLTTSPSLSSSTTYYLCVNTDSASLNVYCDSQSSNAIYVVSQTYGTWSATFSSPTLDWSSHNLGILVN
jgi:tRNA threonylcarbamoyladenosine modification (KEOPS) complex  Pcc1 subunit